MNIICKYRLLALCFLLLGGGMMPVAAQDDYNPPNPAEPNVIEFCKLIVTADPEEGAYANGGGRYRANGTRVYVSTSARNTEDYTYEFEYWTLDGVIYSYNRTFYYYCYDKGEKHFVAHYRKTAVVFDPANPSEPTGSTARRKYFLYLVPGIEGACSFNVESGVKREEGTSVYLRVYPSADYRFEGWMVNGEIINTSTAFYYTMPAAATTIEAVLTEIPFDPSNPNEPSGTGQEDIDNTDIITGIREHHSAMPDADIYDLSGRKVSNMSPGIYIVGGKKVLCPSR